MGHAMSRILEAISEPVPFRWALYFWSAGWCGGMLGMWIAQGIS